MRCFQESRSTPNRERKVAPPVKLERALPGTQLPVSAPQFNPASNLVDTGYREYIEQIISNALESFMPVSAIN
jgi:hypothetical protein